MWSKSVGLASALVLIGLTPTAWAADPKGKAAANAKKKAAELHTTDSAIDKQMAWEDKVMGPDDKRDDLARIAKAQAIAKAAAEKAAAEKAKAEAAGIREEAKAASKPAQKAPAEVVLTVPEEPVKPTKIVEETPPPPPSKPADDKFIDKLLTGDTKKSKSMSKANDGELEALLAKEAKESGKDAPKAKKPGKADSVDSLLETAAKEADKPLPKPKQPDWAKAPEPPPPVAPPPSPILKPAPKKNDGVIRVVQGANLPTASTSTAAAARRPASFAPPAAAPAPAKPSRAAGWNDPFAEGGAGSRKRAAAAAAKDPFADGIPAAPARKMNVAKQQQLSPAKREAPAAAPSRGAGWTDPFADAPSHKPSKRGGASNESKRSSEPPPKAQWKDPFTEAPSRGRPAVAMHETRKVDVAGRRAPAKETSSAPRWGGVLKKRR
jgi:hypothetical protein